MKQKVSITVNGIRHQDEVEPRTLLVHYIRENLGLTGTHIGCDTSQCGACTIHLDGLAVKSCTIFAAQADGSQVTTIEGISSGQGSRSGAAGSNEMHPLQTAFWEQHGLQCGYCTPGMIMAAASLLKENPHPTEDEIRHGLEGNICRCTGYHNIVKAVRAAAGDDVSETASRGEMMPVR